MKHEARWVNRNGSAILKCIHCDAECAVGFQREEDTTTVTWIGSGCPGPQKVWIWVYGGRHEASDV
jgi:hypothetical protein